MSFHFSRAIQKRIMQRAARGEKQVVVVIKNGEPSSVWGFDEYLKRKQLTKTVAPWMKRRALSSVPDPLGALDGAPTTPITRDQIYEE